MSLWIIGPGSSLIMLLMTQPTSAEIPTISHWAHGAIMATGMSGAIVMLHFVLVMYNFITGPFMVLLGQSDEWVGVL